VGLGDMRAWAPSAAVPSMSVHHIDKPGRLLTPSRADDETAGNQRE
jgi:hypothetical protein